ncbi:MAG: biotin/lipoyl-containing protein [Sandaracinaceae bacterium]
MPHAVDGRAFAPALVAHASDGPDGRVELRPPAPGWWRGAPRPGSLIRGGDPIGELEVLGVLHRLTAPEGTFGVVAYPGEDGARLARRPVDHGTLLLCLDPEGVAAGEGSRATTGAAAPTGPVFRTPLGGRYYAQPAPDAPPFVEVGMTLTGGETVALVEVMKTFNRVQYGGPGAPGRARVARVVPEDGADLEVGDVLLELEPTS